MSYSFTQIKFYPQQRASLFLLLSFFLLHYFGTGHSFAQGNPRNIYDLGEIIIQPKPELSDSFSTLSFESMEKMNRLTVSEAVNLMPGIVQTNIGSRNESVVFIRGFDMKHIPVFIDGIPVYVPYDGYADLNRFTNFDLSQIQISKGGSSVLYGANTMGGAINLVTTRPEKPIELNGNVGWLSGGQRASLNAGSRFGKFYAQLGISNYEREFYPLSKKIEPGQNEDGKERDNSYHTDNKISFKLGFVPNEESEYSLAYIRQTSEKGNPLYTGNDTLNQQYFRPRFWQWPAWNKESLYFIGKTTTGSNSQLKSRLFYDSFYNELKSFDDNSFGTQDRPYAFTSIYDDYTLGGSLEWNTAFFRNHFVKMAAHLKQDIHREYAPGQPELILSDYTGSIGIEDVIRLAKQWQLIVGINLNNRASIRTDMLLGNEILNHPDNKSYALNGQMNLSYTPDSARSKVNFMIARKTRFATMKDRYSFRMGNSIANPNLEPEYAWNMEWSLESQIFSGLIFRPAIFYSDIQKVIVLIHNAHFDSESATWLSQQQNLGRAIFYGAEAQLSYRFGKSITTGLNYTYTKRENISNPDILFTQVPEHQLFTYAEYTIKPQTWIVVSGEYNSKRYSTSYGTFAPAFALFHIKTRAKVWKSFALEAGINNILDINYSFDEGFPEPGRNIFVNLVFSY